MCCCDVGVTWRFGWLGTYTGNFWKCTFDLLKLVMVQGITDADPITMRCTICAIHPVGAASNCRCVIDVESHMMFRQPLRRYSSRMTTAVPCAKMSISAHFGASH